MIPTLAPGTRIRLLSSACDLELRSSRGRIVGPGEWQGYYIVRLDKPALYRFADGWTEPLDEIREHVDNMEVL